MRWLRQVDIMKDMRRLPRYLRRLIIGLTVAMTLVGFNSCTRDEDEGDRELAIYLLACPTGPFVCYESCFQENDTDGNGTISGSEFFFYNACNSSCSSRCSLGFLFYYLTDE